MNGWGWSRAEPPILASLAIFVRIDELLKLRGEIRLLS
jgi:hypothetical protein